MSANEERRSLAQKLMKSVASFLRKVVSKIHRARFSDYLIVFINVDDTADSFNEQFVFCYLKNSHWSFKHEFHVEDAQ